MPKGFPFVIPFIHDITHPIRIIMVKERANGRRIDLKERAKKKRKGVDRIKFLKDGNEMVLPPGMNINMTGRHDFLFVYSPREGVHFPMKVETKNKENILTFVEEDVRFYQRNRDLEDVNKYREEMPAILKFAPYIILVFCVVGVGISTYFNYMGLSQTLAGIGPTLEKFTQAMEKLVPILENLQGVPP